MSSSNSNTPFKARASASLQQQGPSPFRSSSADKFRSSLVPTSRPSPARLLSPATKLSKSSPSARDLFRSSKSNSQPRRDLFRTATPQPARTKTFSPDLPASVTRSVASMRKFAPRKSVSAGMDNTGSTEPFAMRISSPDRDLTGEVVAKQIPHDPNRTGTVYADQFLAHKCPEGLDDHQRRQFFCVLDLRRLKYAADEIFAKKDWKLNIINFAKEYEKSRSMIMLRYGLYQFKNMKPSDEVLKKWRASHGLSDPSSPAVGPTKRKADEEMPSKDNTLMDSTVNQNKRRNLAQDSKNPALNGPAPFKKSKRGIDEIEEANENENQPSKMQKSTPSGATSKFESILNKAQSTSSPLKTPAQPSSLFGITKPTDSPAPASAAKANPFAPTSYSTPSSSDQANSTKGPAASVLAGHKIGSTPASNGANIFSYLSESSPNDSGNENGNANEHDDSESEPEHDSEEQGPSAAASTGTSTPPVQAGSLFSTGSYKPDPTIKLFGSMTQSSEPAPKGGLFDRVSMGANGRPLRAVPDAEEQPKQTPAKQPGDFTFNAQTTPISFSKPAASTTITADKLFGNKKRAIEDGETVPTSKKPAVLPSTSSASTEPEQVPTQTDSEPKATSIFDKAFLAQASSAKAPTLPKPTGTFFNKQPSPVPQSVDNDNSNGDSGLGESATNSTSSDTSKDPAGALGFQSTAAPTTSSPSLFGTPSKSDLTTTASASLFGTKKTDGLATPKPSTFETKPAATTSTLFGEKKAEESTKTATSIFGTTPAAVPATPAPSIFSEKKNEGAKNSAPSIFGSTTPAVPSTPSLFGGLKPAEPAKSMTSIFGATSTTPATNGIFGDMKKDEPAKVAAVPSIFGATPAPAATGNLFGDKTAEPAQISSIFGSNAPAANGSMFGSQPVTNGNTQSSSFNFGGSATPSPAVSFGASNSQPNGTEPKLDFQFGSSTPSANSTFTFGQDSAAVGSGFSFTAGGAGQQVNNPFASGQSFSQASGPTTTPSASFNFSFGQQAPSTPTTAPSTQTSGLFSGLGANNAPPSINFTQATPGQTNPSAAPSIFGGFQAGGSGLAGTSSPFPAPSSIGTTPANGTPEPQTANEDGEAPQEQISLTGGGPGEEDETLVHEVRAKALQYIPVKQGGDEEEKSKSPWSTRGVGPLRVLKNNATGSVRVLLRAEPRGHVAMNKAILSHVEYKAKEKTVNFVAASDDGSGLETWVLQVKKPEFAKELAAVLEANKGVNKK